MRPVNLRRGSRSWQTTTTAPCHCPRPEVRPQPGRRPSPAPGSRRPGGRAARTRAAVCAAVRAAVLLTGLAEHGYPALPDGRDG
ncbi:hypothetical protein [Streptomyces sp. NPDC053431]|uniref:hypothetical protein n=1 Tax=Streptomyces sp. NPDC053431 TaxID=3365703 RepID=UPI0037D0EC02